MSVPSQNDLNFGTRDFTVSLWIKAHSWCDPGFWCGSTFIEKWFQTGGLTAWGWSLSSRADGLILSYGDGRTDGHPTSCGDTCLIQYNPVWGEFPSTETWYHLAIKRSGTSLKIYRDGANVATQTYPFIYNLDTSAPYESSLKFGARGYGQYASQEFFNGMIDEVQIYNRALEDNEIAAIASVSGNGYCKGGDISVNAGQNIQIKSDQQCQTTVYGTATDSNNLPLNYRWIEGQTVLLDWRPAGTNGDANLPLCQIPLAQGTHTLTLEVSDGQSTASDDMMLTIDNSAPTAAPIGGGTYQVGDPNPIALGGQVSDYDNDQLHYVWYEGGTPFNCEGLVQAPTGSSPGTPVTLPTCVLPHLVIGSHTVTLRVNDSFNPPVSSDVTINIVDTTAPTLAPQTDKTILWPPNHKMVNIIIDTHAFDDSGLPVTLTAAVASNEPQSGLGDGDMSPDWTTPVINQATGKITLQLRAERSGSGNGRIYIVTIAATDYSGNISTANVAINVPHDQGNK